jgi:CelD/BcsL family acetyltransferase involved in cellulose biosynthesis
LSSLTTPYSCVYRPLIASGLDQATRIAAMSAFARFCRPAGNVRLDALPAEWDGLAALEIGARVAGLVPLSFNHFGNWYENVAGLSWSAYLLRRPGALRETIRRRLRRAEKLAGARFDLLTRADQMKQAAEAFEAVYRRSWKDAEPHPDFNVALMRAMAERGWLRLGVWSVGTEPVAVQFWVVHAGQAVVLKLAHDEAFQAHSPGTVLTALMIRHLLDNEHVARIDLGRGDDTYKQGWAVERRQRVGVLLINPWRPAGLIALLRHASGRIAASGLKLRS